MIAAAGSHGARAVLDLCKQRAAKPFDIYNPGYPDGYDVLFFTGPDAVTTSVSKTVPTDVLHTVSKVLARHIRHHASGHWLNNRKDPRPGCYGA